MKIINYLLIILFLLTSCVNETSVPAVITVTDGIKQVTRKTIQEIHYYPRSGYCVNTTLWYDGDIIYLNHVWCDRKNLERVKKIEFKKSDSLMTDTAFLIDVNKYQNEK